MTGLGSAIPLLGNTAGAAVAVPTEAEALDDIGVTAVPFAARGHIITTTGGIGVGSVLTPFYGVRLVESLHIALAAIVNSNSSIATTDSVTLSEALTRGVLATLTETVGIANTQAILQAVSVLEGLGLAPVLLPQFIYGRSFSDTARLVDSLARFFGVDTSDTISIAPAIVAVAQLSGVTQETIGLAEALTPRLVIRVLTNEGIEISAAEILNMLYAPSVLEGIEITAGYVSPNGNFTAWAMNTRTAAVTEYSNFEFNSFATVGGKPVGASSTGLYELIGGTDAGAAIVSRIKGGFLQFGGTKFSSLKGAYLATRGAADFVLRIETGEGALYNYAVSTRGMRSTKVHMGKGLRARYFSFELISDGDDFDIDTLEFVPIVARRRV